MLGEKKESVKKFVKKEIRKDKFEKNLVSFFLILTILSMTSLFLILMSQISYTGYASYINSNAGTITEVNVTYGGVSSYWFGIYGIAIRIPDTIINPYSTYSYGEVVRQDIAFDCIQENVTGGNEIYISRSSAINFDNLVPANIEDVDLSIGCEKGGGDCPSDTFKSTMSVMVGSRNVSNIPSTKTNSMYGNPGDLNIGVLTDGNNFVYVTKMISVQVAGDLSSYKNSNIINYQAIIPIQKNGEDIRYYFFTDENDVCDTTEKTDLIVVHISGYVKDENNNPVEDATVTLIGESTKTSSSGFYELTLAISPNTLNLVTKKTGYKISATEILLDANHAEVEKDIILELEEESNEEFIAATAEGKVKGVDGEIISGASIYFGSEETTSNSLGNYQISANISSGEHSLVAIKEDYNNYVKFLEFNEDGIKTQDIELEPVLEGDFETGPYEEEAKESEIIEELKSNGEDYWISTMEIDEEVRQDTFIEGDIGIYNLKDSTMSLRFQLSENLKDFVEIDKTAMSISKDASSSLKVTIYGTPTPGTYEGTLTISGDIEQEIPVTIKIIQKDFSVELLLMDLQTFDETIRPGSDLKFKLNLQNLLRNQGYNVELKAKIKDLSGNTTYSKTNFTTNIDSSSTLIEEIQIPENITTGDYILEITAEYLNYLSTATAIFVITKPVYLYSFFGAPLWVMFVIMSSLGFVGLNVFAYKRHIDKKKRYKISVDHSTLPQPGKRVIKLGHIAESKTPAYYEIDKLTTHAIVAGATGMGKSISAQVMIEECLKNNIAVVIFDPTAQWSGMLRKCTDKKMLSFYPKFGMNPKEARAFKGNVRMIQDSRQVLDLNKYIAPGEIQIFSMNKLTPSEIDVFVENAIKQIFRSDPKESPDLKVLLVFDEVHRLLPKFGGSGKGFLQIERSCREFRKWGLGVMLISQVLNDFVGEIKANINTELQARTLDEGDLDRIKSKYGEEFLKSLVRAEIGVIMFQNADYNRGRPYFVNFRPILHSTRRLTDEELQKYNKYNEQVDDIEFQIEELEKEKVDTFDLKMELKLIKDKIMSGSFSVVEIYLEGLIPRVQKEWEKLGKQPPKRELKLVSAEEMAAEDEKTKKEQKAAEENPKEISTGNNIQTTTKQPQISGKTSEVKKEEAKPQTVQSPQVAAPNTKEPQNKKSEEEAKK